MWQDQPKESFLPIAKTELGYSQQSSFQNADLYHEEVLELDNPFAEIASSSTEVLSFLVLGDQNAGKSTFIHSFSYHPDKNYIDLTNELEIISATFYNSRFLLDDAKKPMDEPPFIDTDIARGVSLLTLESFLFWLEENQLPMDEYDRDTRYIAIQFVEIGGDHLDRIVEFEGQSNANNDIDKIRVIVENSVKLLKKTKKTLYFANLATLLDIREENEEYVARFNEANLKLFIQRLSFLSRVFSDQIVEHETLLYFSRSPIHEVNFASNMSFEDTSLNFAGEFLAGENQGNILEILGKFVAMLKSRFQWKIAFTDVVCTNHLNNNGTVNYSEVLNTLKRLFKKGFHSRHEIQELVTTKLLECWENIGRKLKKNSAYSTAQIVYWFSQNDLFHFLEHSHESGLPIPEGSYLTNFEKTLKALKGRHCVLELFTTGHVNLEIRILARCASTSNAISFVWRPKQPQKESREDRRFELDAEREILLRERGVSGLSRKGDEALFRFPCYQPFYAVVREYLSLHLEANEAMSEILLANLREASCSLAEIIRSQFPVFFTEPSNYQWDVIIWLLEDWYLLQIGRAHV